jgi:mono/diheme cytochrome c family protein
MNQYDPIVRLPLVVAAILCLLTGCTGDASDNASVGKERGRQLYEKHGCAACHGAEGHGDGRISQTLNPAPRDFRKPENFRHGYEELQIVNTIRDGVAYDSRVMPKYDYLSKPDRRSMAIYIRSLAVLSD